MNTHNICFNGENYPRIIIKYSSLTSPMGVSIPHNVVFIAMQVLFCYFQVIYVTVPVVGRVTVARMILTNVQTLHVRIMQSVSMYLGRISVFVLSTGQGRTVSWMRRSVVQILVTTMLHVWRQSVGHLHVSVNQVRSTVHCSLILIIR